MAKPRPTNPVLNSIIGNADEEGWDTAAASAEAVVPPPRVAPIRASGAPGTAAPAPAGPGLAPGQISPRAVSPRSNAGLVTASLRGSSVMGARGARIMPNTRLVVEGAPAGTPESAPASDAPADAVPAAAGADKPQSSQQGAAVLSNLMAHVPEEGEVDLSDVPEEQLFQDRMDAWEMLAKAEREQRVAARAIPPRRPSRTPSPTRAAAGDFTTVAYNM